MTQDKLVMPFDRIIGNAYLLRLYDGFKAGPCLGFLASICNLSNFLIFFAYHKILKISRVLFDSSKRGLPISWSYMKSR